MMNSTIFGNNTKSYLSSLPQDMPKAICKAAVYGFAFTTVFSGNPVLGLTSAAFSALATTINILVTPIFANNGKIALESCFIRNAFTSVVILGVASLINPVRSLDIATCFMIKCAFNVIYGISDGFLDTSKADVFFMA